MEQGLARALTRRVLAARVLAARVLAMVGVLLSGAVLATAAAPGAVETAAARPADAPPGRYLVLGDSVPYGHGLADPNRRAHGGLPPNQGPSPLAWPSLVQAALPGLAPLSLRPTGCGLTAPGHPPFDSLAISGAPVIDDRWTGTDGDCPGRSGSRHRAVVPDELDAAGLDADPPSLVTIQAGADDLDFAGCLKSLLGVPGLLGGDPCVTGGAAGPQLTPKARAELAALQNGLRAAVEAVHAAAAHARVVLVDYYQPIPAARASVRGTTAVCAELRARSHPGSWRSALRARADFVQHQLDGAIRAVAAAYPDVRLVEIGSLFAGHEMCTADPWVFSATWDAAHPNAAGQQQIADAVVAVCRTVAGRCAGR